MRRALPAFPVEGGCVCGAVRYRLSGRPRTLYACYCHDCQRFSGGAHSMSMPVRTLAPMTTGCPSLQADWYRWNRDRLPGLAAQHF